MAEIAREVPIFIASSVKEFERERKELAEFLDLLNEVYSDSGVRLVWDRPENMSRALVRGGSQSAYDAKILDCRFFVLIVGAKLGEHTRREFELALEQFVATDHPKILPFFYVPGGGALSDDVAAFRDQLRREQSYYTQVYTDFEQVKATLQIDLERNGAFESGEPEQDSVDTLLKQVKGRVRGEIRIEQKKIDWLGQQKASPRISVEIRKSYERIAHLVQESHVEPDALLDYIDFLDQQHLYDRGIELGHWLENEYKNNDPGDWTWVMLKNRLGLCYADSNQHEQAERYYREEMEISRRLAEKDPAAYEPGLATTCNNLGNLLWSTGRMEEAERSYREAEGIRRRLAEADPAAYDPDLAMTCNNLGNLLYTTGRMEEAERSYREAETIYRRLAEADPAAYEPDLAETCNNLGNLLKDTGRMEEAERSYREAEGISRRLAEADPAAYEPDLAMTCNNLGNLLYTTGQMEEAERSYREAETIYRRLAERAPSAYEPDLAMTCYNLGLFERQRGNTEAARAYFQEALALYEKYPHHADHAQMARDILAVIDWLNILRSHSPSPYRFRISNAPGPAPSKSTLPPGTSRID